jgi:hypothetical protein
MLAQLREVVGDGQAVARDRLGKERSDKSEELVQQVWKGI